MLPEDMKMRKAAKQPSVVEHFAPEDQDTRPIPYSDKALKTAALEWLIETNQVITRCFVIFSFVSICTQILAHSNLQECRVHKDAQHCIASQSGHSASLN